MTHKVDPLMGVKKHYNNRKQMHLEEALKMCI